MTSRYLLRLACIVALGMVTMVYSGPGADPIQNQLGGTFYVLAWMYFVLCIRPNWHPVLVGVIVFFFTCLVEFNQLWDPAWLESVRQEWLGHLVLGSTFDWMDFPAYLLGLLIGLALEHPKSPNFRAD